MSVINKREFFLIWTKQTLRNIFYRYNCILKNPLGLELLKQDSLFIEYRNLYERYGDQVITSQLLANPHFMLDILIAHND